MKLLIDLRKSDKPHKDAKYLRRWRGPDGKWRYEYRQQSDPPMLPPARTLAEARAHEPIPQELVAAHIMKTNPPAQVKGGRMTAEEWANHYMSDEPRGYTHMHVHPGALFYPAPPDMAKVERYRQRDGKDAPPIVLDANDKMQISGGSGPHDSHPGAPPQPHTVLDGKHRALAAAIRGDVAIPAIVPRRLADRLWRDSRQAERDHFVNTWARRQGWRVLGRNGEGYDVQLPNGRTDILTGRDIEREAQQRGYRWHFGD